jgi:hypothetical protein
MNIYNRNMTITSKRIYIILLFFKKIQNSKLLLYNKSNDIIHRASSVSHKCNKAKSRNITPIIDRNPVDITLLSKHF